MKKYSMIILLMLSLVGVIFFYNKENVKNSTLQKEKPIILKSTSLGSIKAISLCNLGETAYLRVVSYDKEGYYISLVNLLNLTVKTEQVTSSKYDDFKIKSNINCYDNNSLIPYYEFPYIIQENLHNNKLMFNVKNPYNVKSKDINDYVVGKTLVYINKNDSRYININKEGNVFYPALQNVDKDVKLFYDPEELVTAGLNKFFFIKKDKYGSVLKACDYNGVLQGEFVDNVITADAMRNKDNVVGIRKDGENYELFSFGEAKNILAKVKSNSDSLGNAPRAIGLLDIADNRNGKTRVYYTEFDKSGLGNIKCYDEEKNSVETILNKKKILSKIDCIKNYNRYILYYEIEGDKILPRVYDEMHNNVIDVSKYIGL